MKLNSRQIEVISCLLKQSEFITTQALSNTFDVSPRTIRNDLYQIRDYLKEQGVLFDITPSKGCRIVVTKEQANHIIGQLNKDKEATDEEFTACIFWHLLCTSSTYEALAELCAVGKSKIISLMPKVEEMAEGFKLELVREKGTGIFLEGNERDIRKAAHQMIVDDHQLLDSRFIPETSMKFADSLVSMVETTQNIQYYNHAKLKMAIAYSMYRISVGRTLVDSGLSNEEESSLDFSEILENYPFTKPEKEGLRAILLSFKYRSYAQSETDNSEAYEIAVYLSERLQELHDLDGTLKERFIKGLTTHLEVALYRIYNNMPIENALVNQVKLTIPLIYEYTYTSLLACEKKYKIRFEESEIAYIAMYVGSAYENSITIDTRVKVLLLCAFGTATSSILKTRMEMAMPDCRIEGPFSKEEALRYIEHNSVDLVISTNTDTLQDLPVIKVNPLLRVEEIDAIRAKLFQISYSKMCRAFMESYARNEEKQNICCYLSDLIPLENIQISEQILQWEEAIQLSAEPLLKKKQIEQRYVTRMINAVKELGTYMVLADETAFVHAGTDDGITADCMSLLCLRTPVVFGNINAKMVRNIVVLGIKDRQNHTMLNIVNILAKAENLELMKRPDLTVEMITKIHD